MCNVSFNGFDFEGGKVLADVIKSNESLEHLNISNTRLNADCAASIANALGQNDMLKTLIVSCNSITASGALAIIYAIKLSSSSGISHLDLSVSNVACRMMLTLLYCILCFKMLLVVVVGNTGNR